MSEWTEYRLGELLKVHHGFPFSGDQMTDELTGAPIVVSIGNFSYSGGFRFESTRVREFRGEYPREFELTPGDLLVIMTCQTEGGEILGVPGFAPHDERVYLHNQRIGRVECDESHLSRSFAYYLFLSESVNRQLFNTATGTKILHTSPTRISEVRVRVPNLPEQQKIAGVLGALDEKIASNDRLLDALEELGRALFERSFAEAVEYLAEAKPLPAGWVISNLGDATTVIETGKRPKGGVAKYSSGIPSVGAESIVRLAKFDFEKVKYVPDDFFATMKRGVVQDRDVLLYKDGGKPGDFKPHVSMFGNGFPFGRMCINEHVYRVRMKSELGQEFGYYWLSSPPIMGEMRRRGTGAAIPGINSTAVKGIPVVEPPAGRLLEFRASVEPLVERALQAAAESRTLANLRQTLLPQLMSGKLRVRDAEKIVEDAA